MALITFDADPIVRIHVPRPTEMHRHHGQSRMGRGNRVEPHRMGVVDLGAWPPGWRAPILLVPVWNRAISRAARAGALPTEQMIAEDPRHGRVAAPQRRSQLPRDPHRHPRARTGHRHPVGRRHDRAPDAAATAASRVWTMRWPPPFPATRKMEGFRLTASDTSWTIGQGPASRHPSA